MKKLSLELEKLAVDAFEPGPAPEQPIGTVRAHAVEAANDPQAAGAMLYTGSGIPTCASPYCATTVAS